MNRFTALVLMLTCMCFAVCFSAISQTVFSTKDSVAIFYPKAFEAKLTLPSFILQSEPVAEEGLPVDWLIKPVFSTSSGKSVVKVNCGTADFYGTGEVTGTLKRNNTSITLWNSDNYGYEKYAGKQLYQSHPWVMGVRLNGTAFGIIADNTWKMDIEITNTSILFVSDGPAFRVLVFEGKSPQDVLKKLADLSGKIELPPVWSFGYQQCRYSYMNETEVKELANKFRTKKLPCDVLWMDIDYMDQYKIFTFSNTAFPSPAALNTYLHALNFKSVWMIDPGIKKESGYAIYDQGTAANHWVLNNKKETFVGNVWPGPCVFPDYTIPATRTWWSNLYATFMPLGVDGVWNDMNEPSVFSGGEEGSMPADNIHRGGDELPEGTHLRYHNVYGQLMVKASREGIQKVNPEKRPFILSRSNFLGGQKYAATWTGDNKSTHEHMKLSVPMSLNMGLSGQPISGPDVGGFAGSCTGNLLGHWMALGAFYPFYRNHSDKNTAPQEPWAFSTAIEESSRTSLQRRYRLLPYLYTLAYEASVTGLPIMRPLFFAEPTNLKLRNQEEAFLLGENLMIVPKWATNVKYPTGKWDVISLVGENSKTDKYQPDVLLKQGSILPLGQIIQSSVDYSTDSLTLIVALHTNGEANGYLYTDAGEGFEYQTGRFQIRDFTVKPFDKDSLVFESSVRNGTLSTEKHKYRVGILTENNIVYTAWESSPSFKILNPNKK